MAFHFPIKCSHNSRAVTLTSVTLNCRSYLAAEAGLLMTLRHRNIVEVYGVCTAPLQPLIVTELVSGRNLHDKLHSNTGYIILLYNIDIIYKSYDIFIYSIENFYER